MQPPTEEPLEQYFDRLSVAASTLTQEQIDACAWVMGASAVGWNKIWILHDLEKEKNRLTNKY
jgi:hypothetical protein